MIEGLRPPLLAAVCIRGRFAALAIPVETHVEVVSVPFRISVDPGVPYLPITGDGFEAVAEALIANLITTAGNITVPGNIIAAGNRRFRSADVRILYKRSSPCVTLEAAEFVGGRLAALGAPIEAPVKTIAI